MERAVQYMIAGLSTGSLYTLVALGLVLIYRSSRILNFSHGDIATAGTFLAFTLIGMHFSFWTAITLSLLFGAAMSMTFYFVVLVPAQRREASIIAQIILTLGLSLIVQGFITRFGGTDPRPFPFFLSETRLYKFGIVVINSLSLGTLTTGVLSSLLFYLLIQKTRTGLAIRAASENLEAALTLGLPTDRVLALSWGLSAVLGVIAGLFLAPVLLLDPFFMLDPFLKGFAAAILGGLNSLPGAILGGLILGVIESFASAYISIAFKNTLAFLIIIVVLLVRPSGLLGRTFRERV